MESKVHKKSKKTKSRTALASDSPADAQDNGGLDDGEELHSLTHYAGDEEELVNHMFAAIQGTKLEAMMPAAIKAIPLQDLKLLCVHELRGISKKRIIAIIKGNSMSDSSGSDDSDSDDGEELELSSRRRGGGGPSPAKRGVRHANGTTKTATIDGVEKPMDIVELEMRARLIETMLKKNTKKNDQSSDVQVKAEPLSDRSRSRSYSSRSYSDSRSSSSRSYSDSGSGGKKHGSHHRRSRKNRHHKSSHKSSRRRNSSSSVTPDREVGEGDSAKKTTSKKSKISRKEFEDRMKKAKENRTYRKRKDSDEDEKRLKENEFGKGKQNDSKSRSKQNIPKPLVDKNDHNREDGEAESEKEEGEIDSNEDEGSYYSDRSAKHRSNNRSGSRSSRSSRSSYSDKSRSRSTSRRRSRKSKDKRRDKKRETQLPVDKNLILASLNDETRPVKSKPGIETVDSDEDFDSVGAFPVRSVTLEEGSNLVLRTDRTNVSFSFTKKLQPNLTQGTDLEFGRSVSRPMYKSPIRKVQIVISSDSENEAKSKSRKSKQIDPNVTLVSIDNPTVIAKQSDSSVVAKDGTLNSTDQSDLKLCEETVMQDIFDDMDEETDSTRLQIKKELFIKSEPIEMVDSEVKSIETKKRQTSKSDKECISKSVRRSEVEGSESNYDTESLQVKQEMLSPRRESDSGTTDISVSRTEPYNNENAHGLGDDRSLTSDNRRKKKKKHSKQMMHSPGSCSTEVEPSFRDQYKQTSKSNEKDPPINEVHDSEEGACTDQETDVNDSFAGNAPNTSLNETDHSVDNNVPGVLDDQRAHEMTESAKPCQMDEDAEKCVQSSPNESYSSSHPIENVPDNENKNTDSQSIEEGEDDEDEGGLVDLADDEHFEIMDDDDNVGGNFETEVPLIMEHDTEDGEVTSDKGDFYRGVQDLDFNKDNSRSGMDDKMVSTMHQDHGTGNGLSAIEDGELEEGEVDDILVELNPEDADAISAVADASTTVEKEGNTEIIGEIEPSAESSTGMEHIGVSSSSWSTRWLQSEKVQKVVTSSKMLSRMRKRIKKDKMDAKSAAAAAAAAATAPPAAATTATVTAAATVASATIATADTITAAAPNTAKNEDSSEAKSFMPTSVQVIGSMEEYHKMIAEQGNIAVPETGGGESNKVTPVKPPADHSSEDSEDDELWSKMMGN